MRWLDRVLSRWRAGRERDRAAAMDRLKARYHIFRVLLANNERALSGLAEADRLLRAGESSPLPAAVQELRDVVLELADGLNRLTGNAHAGLYPRLEQIERALDAALAGYEGAPRSGWIPLADVRPDMREEAGGKAQPLGGLMRAGLPVPEGLCLTRRFCREYLTRARLSGRLEAILRAAAEPEAPDGGGAADLPALAERARNMIAASDPDPESAAVLRGAWERLACPGGISVRSSASSEDGGERSYAGQYASVLGVRDHAGFVAAFKTVLASAFSARALAYRAMPARGGAGAPAGGSGAADLELDMAVLCQRLVDARCSGVLFSVDPTPTAKTGGGAGRMLLTAVPGLGTQAVSGRAPADVYRPARDPRAEDISATPADIADKSVREVALPESAGGGLRLEDVPEAERAVRLLSDAEVALLRDNALRIEALAGRPQDIEWSIDKGGALWILQARPARIARPVPSPSPNPASDRHTALAAGVRPVPTGDHVPGGVGEVLLSGGVAASPGRAAGRLVVARSREELAEALRGPRPMVLALRQSLVDAASLAPEAAAILVDLGNPLDHLAGLARELDIPMITGLGSATTALAPGQWVLADADGGLVRAVDPELWRDAPRPAPRAVRADTAAARAVRELVLKLNLTDAYGPTFSILEAKSLHDMVRYAHEKAVMALFDAGDAIAEDTFSLVRRLREPAGLIFLIIDLGGGLAPGGREVEREDIRSAPLAALCRGMSAPGLRWGTPPPVAGLSGLVSRGMLDARSERPVGNPNYALIARDYLNLNARVDYHFVLVDCVCGPNPRENSLRFRFKGGGTSRVQRERRAVCVEEVLRREDFFTSRQGDMVTAFLTEIPREAMLAKVETLGRFIGFSRLLDAVMVSDAMPSRVAEAFLTGDYGLDRLAIDLPGGDGLTD